MRQLVAALVLALVTAGAPSASASESVLKGAARAYSAQISEILPTGVRVQFVNDTGAPPNTGIFESVVDAAFWVVGIEEGAYSLSAQLVAGPGASVSCLTTILCEIIDGGQSFPIFDDETPYVIEAVRTGSQSSFAYIEAGPTRDSYNRDILVKMMLAVLSHVVPIPSSTVKCASEILLELHLLAVANAHIGFGLVDAIVTGDSSMVDMYTEALQRAISQVLIESILVGGFACVFERGLSVAADVAVKTLQLMVKNATAVVTLGLSLVIEGAILSYNIYSTRSKVVPLLGTTERYTVFLIANEESNESGSDSPFSSAVALSPTPTNSAPSVNPPSVRRQGLLGEVFALEYGTRYLPKFDEISTPPIGRIFAATIDVPNRSYRYGYPGLDGLVEWFAIRFAGSLRIDTAGEYRFRLNSDDGSKLYIDGILIINNDGTHWNLERYSEGILLEAGDHEIVIEYFQGPRYDIALQLLWALPQSEVYVLVPPEVLSRK